MYEDKYEFRRVHHITILVKDFDKSVANYERVFGFPPLFRGDYTTFEKWGIHSAMFKMGETWINLVTPDLDQMEKVLGKQGTSQEQAEAVMKWCREHPDYEGVWHIALQVDGLEALLEHQKKNGVKLWTQTPEQDGFGGALYYWIDPSETDGVCFHTYDKVNW